jgi:hypothetical protein
MLLTAIWNILSKLVPYSPQGFLVDRPANQSKIITKSQALHLVRLRGYVIKDDISPSATA